MDEYEAYRRRLCMRPDAHLAMSPDAHLFLHPNRSLWLRPVHPDERKYSPDQPRVPAGNSDGGQWTREGGTPGQIRPDNLEQSFRTASDQRPRSDLAQLRDVANDPWIAAEVRSAWVASNPYTENPRENGFWICRNEKTGDLFARPFASRGFAESIVPGPTPADAVAFFHTHPNSPGTGAIPGPSLADEYFASIRGLPGLLFSHNGMYYFGPAFTPWVPPRQEEKRSMPKHLPVRMAALTAAQLMVGPSMSHANCELLQIAEQTIAQRYPRFDPTGKKLVITESGHLWEMTYRLPPDMLGGAPIITIDKRTCKVVRVQLTQ